MNVELLGEKDHLVGDLVSRAGDLRIAAELLLSDDAQDMTEPELRGLVDGDIRTYLSVAIEAIGKRNPVGAELSATEVYRRAAIEPTQVEWRAGPSRYTPQNRNMYTASVDSETVKVSKRTSWKWGKRKIAPSPGGGRHIYTVNIDDASVESVEPLVRLDANDPRLRVTSGGTPYLKIQGRDLFLQDRMPNHMPQITRTLGEACLDMSRLLSWRVLELDSQREQDTL